MIVAPRDLKLMDSIYGSAQKLSQKEYEGALAKNKQQDRSTTQVTQSQTFKNANIRDSLQIKQVSLNRSPTKSNESLNLKGSIEYDTITADDVVIMGDGNPMAKSEKAGYLGKRRSMSMATFYTVDSHYKVPKHDYKYHIKHGLPFGDREKKPKDYSYMTQVVDRAKSSVDPRKYNR